jgi:hypothetical protein
VRVFDIPSIKEWVVLRGPKKGICCTSDLTLQSPRPNAPLTLSSNCPVTAHCASHSRLLWSWRRNPPLGSLLSDSRPLLHQFSHFPYHRPSPPSPLRQHRPARSPRPRYQHQHRKPPFARRSPRWTIQTPECLYSTRSATRSSPRETTTRPVSGCASDSARLPPSFPQAAAQPGTARPNDGGDGDVEDNDDALAVPGFGSPASIADTGGAVRGGIRPRRRAARMAEWVPAQTTMTCLDLVEVEYLGWEMADAGSEAGVGL